MENSVPEAAYMKINVIKYYCSNFFHGQKLKSRVSIQFKPTLDIFFSGSSFLSCPQHSSKILLLLNPKCILKCVHKCEQNVSFYMFLSGFNVVTSLVVFRQNDCMHFCCMCIPYICSEPHNPYVGRIRS